MTYREEIYLAYEASERILGGTDESEVETYVYEKVGRNPYIFKDVWDTVMWLLDYEYYYNRFSIEYVGGEEDED